MLLPSEDAALFLRLYPALLGFVAGRLGGIEGIHDLASFHTCAREAKAKVRDQLYENLHLLDAYVSENPDGWSDAELELIAAWHRVRRGTFIALRDLKKFTLLLDEHEPPRVYGVLGLTTELADMMPFPLPVMLQAVLLPWKGQIVCDGLIVPYNVILGGGIRRNAEESYRQAKIESGIITILEETDAAESAAPVLRGRDRRSKVRVNVLLDSDVLAYFEQEAKRSGRRRDTLINATLRQAIEETVSEKDSSRR
ncbi:MAG: hypothetical protein HY268_28405 [Deltaproteobacteria bacterium]|nr:hypothetical protein [Deltaproteobacteria bacterium]